MVFGKRRLYFVYIEDTLFPNTVIDYPLCPDPGRDNDELLGSTGPRAPVKVRFVSWRRLALTLCSLGADGLAGSSKTYHLMQASTPLQSLLCIVLSSVYCSSRGQNDTSCFSLSTLTFFFSNGASRHLANIANNLIPNIVVREYIIVIVITRPLDYLIAATE